MAWTDSRVFAAFLADSISNTAEFDLSGASVNTFNVSLIGTNSTPDKDAVAASTAYNTGAFTADKITDTGTSAPAGWPTVGRPLVTPAVTTAAGTLKWDAVDTASANAVTTLTATFGCLIYSDTLATPVVDQGVCFNYFGGTQSVTLGTFTIVWNTAGIFTITY